MPEFEIPFVKICGVTSSETMQVLEQSGATAVGINVVPTSPRAVDLEMACSLCEEARRLELYSVVVVRDASEEVLAQVVSEVSPDCIQLHGAEVPAVIAFTGECDVIKAVSWSGRQSEVTLAEAWREALESSSQVESRIRAFLVDAYAPIEGGGTGRQARWDLLAPRPKVFEGLPLILAGGLTPKNVYEAILGTSCDGVDTASGVELEPGIQSEVLVQQFGTQAHHGFARK